MPVIVCSHICSKNRKPHNATGTSGVFRHIHIYTPGERWIKLFLSSALFASLPGCLRLLAQSPTKLALSYNIRYAAHASWTSSPLFSCIYSLSAIWGHLWQNPHWLLVSITTFRQWWTFFWKVRNMYYINVWVCPRKIPFFCHVHNANKMPRYLYDVNDKWDEIYCTKSSFKCYSNHTMLLHFISIMDMTKKHKKKIQIHNSSMSDVQNICFTFFKQFRRDFRQCFMPRCRWLSESSREWETENSRH